MVNTPHYDLDTDNTLGGNNASDYVIPSQSAIKYYVDHSSGGIVVDNAMSSTSENPVQNKVISNALDRKQATLVSGTNIKTINSTSILGSGDIAISMPTNYVTTDTAQDISGRKTFLGEKAIYFKQSSANNKLGFTLYNISNAELGALEYKPNTIGSSALLALNCPQTTGGYVGFRYWGAPAINIIAPKPTTAGNYYIPVRFTDGTNTVTASSNGTVDLSSLTPSVETFTATEIETLWNSI